MKKKILFGFTGFIFGTILLMNVTLASNDQSTTIDLITIGKIASAACETPPLSNCPGGSCSHLDSFGDCCTACCPTGKDPLCDATGCRCW